MVHEVKVSHRQEELYKQGVEKHGFNKKYKGDYAELANALREELNEKDRLKQRHAEEMAYVDLKINYLQVKTDVIRKKSGVEADLRDIINAHLKKVHKLEQSFVVASESTPPSSKKQRK